MEAGIDIGNNGEQQRESVLLVSPPTHEFGGAWTRPPLADVAGHPEFRAWMSEQDGSKSISNVAGVPENTGEELYVDPALIDKECTFFEQANSHNYALREFYGNSQMEMANKLDLDPSTLCRILQLLEFPKEVIEAFGDTGVLKLSYSARLTSGLRKVGRRERIVSEAVQIAAAQGARSEAGERPISPENVLKRLVAAHADAKTAPVEVNFSDRGVDGRGAGAKVSLSIPRCSSAPA